MKILIFGIGSDYEKYKKYFIDCEIVGLLDNNSKKIGSVKDGITIYNPAKGVEREFDKIFITSTAYIDEMTNQLISLNVSREKIVTLFDMKYQLDFNYEKNAVTIYSDANHYMTLFSKEKSNIAILTNSLGINGGDMTVLYVAKILIKSYNVHIISRMDGPLRDRFSDLNITVIIDDSISIKSTNGIPWINSYDLIFANGLIFYSLFDTPESTSDINAVWWIHSSGDMNKHIPFGRLNVIPQGNVSVYGVSNRAIKSFKKCVPSWNIDNLCYGIESKNLQSSEKKQEKIVFAVIGSVCKRKAQDLFIEAVARIPKYKRDKCEFWIVGAAYGKKFGEELLKRIESMPFIKYLGVVDNISLFKNIYPKISVLVCPSLEDTMPIVCAEAMMYSHPCIVSKNTGTAQYIENKENGLIFETGKVDDLENKIEWMIDNDSIIDRMGEEARDIYEHYFSKIQFEYNLKKIIENKLRRNRKDTIL